MIILENRGDTLFPLLQKLPLGNVDRGKYPFIGPFWSDIDVSPYRFDDGYVYYDETNNETLLNQTAQDINLAFNGVNFMPVYALIVTWFKVSYRAGNTDEVNNY